MKYKILENQNIFDIALQVYGNVEATFDILKANPGMNGITDNLLPGTLINLPDNVDNIANVNIQKIYTKNNQKVTTGSFKQEGIGYWVIEQNNIIS